MTRQRPSSPKSLPRPRPDRAAAIAEATALVDSLPASGPSPEERARLLSLIDAVFASRLAEGELLPPSAPGNVLILAGRLAAEGDGDFLAALMRATDGWYGMGGEGGEWLNELLWETLVAQPALTLLVLAGLPTEERDRLVDTEYTRPVHDGFDFAAVIEGLRAAEVPPGLEEAVERIIAVAEVS
jgi:hypothetical protein